MNKCKVCDLKFERDHDFGVLRELFCSEKCAEKYEGGDMTMAISIAIQEASDRQAMLMQRVRELEVITDNTRKDRERFEELFTELYGDWVTVCKERDDLKLQIGSFCRDWAAVCKERDDLKLRIEQFMVAEIGADKIIAEGTPKLSPEERDQLPRIIRD